jgi:hypothetical protein
MLLCPMRLPIQTLSLAHRGHAPELSVSLGATYKQYRLSGQPEHDTYEWVPGVAPQALTLPQQETPSAVPMGIVTLGTYWYKSS